MSFKLKHIFAIFIFSGFFLSSFQITINQFIKNAKVNSIELSVEDIDDNEEDAETKKIELEDDYFFSEFNFSFTQIVDLKVNLFCKMQSHSNSPVIAIKIPPPKA